jgi:hypothetical protein
MALHTRNGGRRSVGFMTKHPGAAEARRLFSGNEIVLRDSIGPDSSMTDGLGGQAQYTMDYLGGFETFAYFVVPANL